MKSIEKFIGKLKNIGGLIKEKIRKSK